MNVTFTKTGERRYRVSVEGKDVVSSWMEPAAGYDARLPHDMAHFVVENELGITGGVFGQLAGGGHARTFHPTDEQSTRKVVKRGKRLATANRGDAELSEKVIFTAWRTWNNDPSVTPLKGVSEADIRRVCREFDAVSAIWSRLAVGESMTLVWRRGVARAARRRPKRN
jgi:anaerobic selenocysteine-containing dehydrogenase